MAIISYKTCISEFEKKNDNDSAVKNQREKGSEESEGGITGIANA